MAIFLANRSLQTVLVQSRSLLISSWAKKRYKSSGLVRYIPRDTQIKKAQKFSPLESSDKKETNSIRNKASKRGRGARKVLEDNEFGHELFVSGTVKASDIYEQVEEFSELKDATDPVLELVDTDASDKSGPFLVEVSNSNGNNVTDSNKAINIKIRDDAEKAAIELLAARAFTAVELRKKLHGKKYPLNVVESVIADIKSRGLLNDGLYAETFSRSRWLSSTWGPRRIKQALIQKGVSEAEVDEATKQLFEEDDPSDGSSYTQHGMSKHSMDHLLLQASKQWLRGKDASPDNRKARIVRWLQYRGFNWGVTNFVLKKLESQYPPRE